MKRAFPIAICLGLAGCGPNKLAGAGSTAEPLVFSPVQTLASIPAGAKVIGEAQAISCKSKAWDPDPSEENALQLLKSKAEQMNGSAVVNVAYTKGLVNPILNCWLSITATGTVIGN